MAWSTLSPELFAATTSPSPNLANNNITDAGLVHLGGLQQLKVLDVTYTQVTAEGVERLQRTLPDLEVFHY